jgi:DNA-binding protein YbaB
VAVVADHRAQVDELVADYRRSREQLAAVQRALAAIRESATSEDGSVTATVGVRGTLTGLVITHAAYRSHRPAELADLIVRTTAAAATRATRSASDIIAAVLPSATDPSALLQGTADLQAGELQPATPDPDEGFEEHTWLPNPRRHR